MPERACPLCCQPLPEGSHGNRIYCSPSCAGIVRQRRARGRCRKIRPCKQCGAEFQPVRDDRALFCTFTCRSKWKRLRRIDKQRQIDRWRYRHDPAFRARKIRSAARTYYKRRLAQKGSRAWVNAMLAAERDKAAKRIDPRERQDAVFRAPP